MDREGGFFVIHRRVRSSALYRSLSAEQRSVFYTLLLLANWKDGALPYAGKWTQVRRGELAHSLETIAGEAGTSVKVVRTTLRRLMADDRETGGNGPFLTERWTGGEPSRGLRILVIARYDDYQRLDALIDESSTNEVGANVFEKTGTASGTEEGTATGTPRTAANSGNADCSGATQGAAGTATGTGLGTPSGTAGARQGHASGTAGAPREPEEPEEPRKPLSLVAEARASDDAGPFGRVVEVWSRVCVPAGFAKAHATAAQKKKAATRMREPGWFDAFQAACAYVATEPFYRGQSSSGWVLTLGWLLEPGKAERTAEKAATKRVAPAATGTTGRGMAPPSKNYGEEF